MITTKKGFTLIEILIVVAIIAILASIVLVGLGPTQQSARDARRLGDLHDIQNVVELYYNKCGFYPGSNNCAGTLAAAKYSGGPSTFYGGMATAVTAATTGLGISTLPQDPSSGGSYYYAVPGLVNPTDYVLAAKLENPGGSSAFTNYTAPTSGWGNGDQQMGATGGNCGTAQGYYCEGI